MSKSNFPSIVSHLSESVINASKIDAGLFEKFSVKRGLRNADHSGVLVGLTNVGDVVGYKKEGDAIVPIDGKLIYRGIDIEALVQGAIDQKRHGFDEVVYLLLSGKLPNKQELAEFKEYMGALRELPDEFTNSMILANKGQNVMNMLARSVLGLYNLDKNAEDTSPENLVNQSSNLIAKFPTIIAYSYHSMRHFYQRKTLSIRHPNPALSTAENFLLMMKGEGKYTQLEADILDLYEMIETLAPQIFYDFKGDKVGKRVCANVDFYSGFVYNCFGIKEALYTPLFAMSRIAGWCSHRLEELTFDARRIIRPAYKNVFPQQSYKHLKDRE